MVEGEFQNLGAKKFENGFACLICSGFYNPTYEIIEKELREVGGLIMREALKMDKLPENQLEKNLNIKLLRGEE